MRLDLIYTYVGRKIPNVYGVRVNILGRNLEEVRYKLPLNLQFSDVLSKCPVGVMSRKKTNALKLIRRAKLVTSMVGLFTLLTSTIIFPVPNEISDNSSLTFIKSASGFNCTKQYLLNNETKNSKN